MYFKYVNILYLIILSCLCMKICALEIGMEQYRVFTYKDSVDCIIPLPKPDNGMPVLYSQETRKTVYPNRQGLIIIKLNNSIRMSCTGKNNHFVSPISTKNATDIEVKCIRRSFLQYEGVDYHLQNFTCSKIPESELRATEKPCHTYQGNVFNVGFQTKYVFIILYSLCFNTDQKYPIFAWYSLDVPAYRLNQNSTTTPHYIHTNTFDPVDINEVYENQQDTMVEIMRDDRLGKWYVQLDRFKTNDCIRYLVKGHCMSETEFIYTYEQHATYYNENTAPQWLMFHKTSKRRLERIFKQYVLKRNGKHVVVSGTHKVSQPLNFNLTRTSLYMNLPDQVPVPDFFWKMDYDPKTRSGLVFIGYNGPFRSFESSRHFCVTTQCPYKASKWKNKREMYYCCTRASFEAAFGRVDSFVYDEY